MWSSCSIIGRKASTKETVHEATMAVKTDLSFGADKNGCNVKIN